MNSTKKETNLIGKVLSHKILFSIHAFAYVAVNLLLTLIWTVTLGLAENKYCWPFFAMFGWGFGVGFHALIYLTYNDASKYLSKIRDQFTLGVVFMVHSWFYIIVNLFLMILNLTSLNLLNLIWFPWVLSVWGIGFGIHGICVFTWENVFNAQLEKLRLKGDSPEERLKKVARNKIAGFWILLIHSAYFVVVNTFLFTSGILDVINQLTEGEIASRMIVWTIVLLLHLLGYYLSGYVEAIKPELKGLIWHVVAYLSLNTYAAIYQFTPQNPIMWIQYSTILWGIVLVLHGLVVLKWNSIKNHDPKTNRRIFWECSFIFHVPVYIVGVILIGMQFISLGIDITLLIYPAMGWSIGLCVHCALFIVVWRNITDFWKWTVMLHLGAYIPTSIFLVIINSMLLPGFLWSLIAIAGWGVGFGTHVLIAIFLK